MTLTTNHNDTLTIREAAKLSDCHSNYMYDRVKHGAFKSQRVAGRLFIERASFMAWLEGYKIRRPQPRSEELQP